MLVTSLLLAGISCSPGSDAGNYRIALVPSRQGQTGIFVMNADSSGGKLLCPDVAAQLRQSSWSRDGSKIAFFSLRPEDKGMMQKYRMPSHFPLYVMEASGGGQKRLFDYPVSSFEWSPDSRKLLFVSAYEDPGANDTEVVHGGKAPMSAIYVFELQSGKQTRLTSFGHNCSASWSPDGDRVALSLESERESDTYITTLDAKHGKRLSQSSTIESGPVWAPDGRSIALLALPFPGAETQDAGVYVIDVDSGKKQRVSDKMTYAVSWSPDGKTLMMQSASGIYLADRDGQNLRRLSTDPELPYDAVFAPDGKKIIFRLNSEGTWQLCSMDLDGRNLKRITSLSAAQFSLSPLLSKH